MKRNKEASMEMDKQEAMDKPVVDMDEKDDEPKIKYRGWKVMPFIIGNETFEKLGAIGTLANLLVYLTTVFNMKTITATTIINIFHGTSNLSTLIGAFLSDSYFGRYITLGFCTIVSFLGLLVIQLTAAIPKLHPPTCSKDSLTCTGPTAGQMAFLLMGFGLMIVGAAGIRPCNLAFGADQFNPKTEPGKRGINSFFNWYFFTFTFAQMISLTLIVYVQSNVSWPLGLGIPAILMLLACVLFFMGSNMYVKVPATGSPMTSIVQVIVATVRKRGLKQPDQPWLSLFNYFNSNSINSKLPYTDQFRCVNKAAIRTPEDKVNPDGSASNPWRLCSIQQVEEVKCVMRVIPIWASNVLYHIVIVQQHSYAVFQALQSDRRLGSTQFIIPAASYYVFLMVSFTAFIPIYDRVLVPFLRRITGKEEGITLLQRIGIGTVISIGAMLVSGIVEERRRSIALTRPTLGHVPRKGAISSMSGMWLVPQLALAGLSETFASVGHMEFYYKQFPENMRSIAGSLFYCALAGASYLSSFLISVVHRTTRGAADGNWLSEDLNKGRLDWYYYLIAGLEVANLCYFLMCANWYKYKGTGVVAPEIAMEANKTQKAEA